MNNSTSWPLVSPDIINSLELPAWLSVPVTQVFCIFKSFLLPGSSSSDFHTGCTFSPNSEWMWYMNKYLCPAHTSASFHLQWVHPGVSVLFCFVFQLPWLTRSLDWPHFGTTPRLSWFPQPLLKSLQLFRVWKKSFKVLKLVASNTLQLRKLCWMVWWPLRYGCSFISERPQANVALLAMMSGDQSLISDLSSYLNALGSCVTGLLSE